MPFAPTTPLFVSSAFISSTAPAVVRIARTPVAVPAVVPVDHDIVTVQSHETADNIVWGTLAEDDFGAWVFSLENARTRWDSLNLPTL